MRFLSADKILGEKGLMENRVILVREDGLIEAIEPLDEIPGEKVEFFEGLLSPGFINAHCHLELSHLKGQIPERTGLPGFALEVVKKRTNQDEAARISAAETAAQEMWELGIQGLGDISNGTDSFPAKANAPIKVHTFVEVLGFHPSRAEAAIHAGLEIREKAPGGSCLSPHAPYSVSPALLLEIYNQEKGRESPLSIHLSESPDEDQFFLAGEGGMMGLYDQLGLDMSWWQAPGTTSAGQLIPQLEPGKRMLFVHTTILSKEDRSQLLDKMDDPWFCLCPNANLYIEGQLPDVPGMLSDGCKMVIGTDSLASNWQLDILEELKTLHKQFPKISAQSLLQMATQNGADLFGWNALGRFAKGARPGVVLVKGMDENSISEDASSRRII